MWRPVSVWPPGRSASVLAPEWRQPPSHPREGGLRPLARSDSSGRGLGNVWEELTSVRSGVAPFRGAALSALPWEGPRLLSLVTEEPECEVPRSFLSLRGRGSPTGSCGGNLSRHPRVGPHSELINCSSLLPGLVTGPGSWGLEFSENCCGFPFPTAWLTPIPRAALWRPGREEVGRGEQAPEKLKLRWEGLQSGEKGPGKTVGLPSNSSSLTPTV